ncbi:MAG: ABC transporter substrate-binding protein [Desulfurococcaceae archaeon]
MNLLGIKVLGIALVAAALAGGLGFYFGKQTSNAVPQGLVQACGVGYGLLDRIKNRGTLVVGTSADWPPYEYVAPDGSFAGIDMAIAKKIAGALGVKLEIKDMQFSALFEAVQRGDVDIAIADIAMKPSRLQAVDFSIPYRCEDGKAIIMRASDAPSYKGIESLYGKTVGVQLGTTEQDLAEKYLGNNATIVTYDRVYPEMVMALKTGRVDAIITAPDVAQLIVHREGDLAIVGKLPFFSCSVIVMPHCAYDLNAAVSQVLWDMLQSGEIKNITASEIDKWLALQGG